MLIAVLADIHANAPALEAVLSDSQKRGAQAYWFLGDAAGYGPHPAAAVHFLSGVVSDDDWVLGNHDAMLADLLTGDDAAGDATTYRVITQFGHRVQCRGQLLSLGDWQATSTGAIQALRLNRAALQRDARADAFWRSCFTPDRIQPRSRCVDGVDHVRVHGGQAEWLTRYIYAWDQLYLPREFEIIGSQALACDRPRVQWYGHTHVPTLVLARMAGNAIGRLLPVEVVPCATYRLEADLALVNPGSVGQPRDLDQRAAYALLDTAARSVSFRRVAYNSRAVEADLGDAGYPEQTAELLRDAPLSKEAPTAWRNHFCNSRERCDESLSI